MSRRRALAEPQGKTPRCFVAHRLPHRDRAAILVRRNAQLPESTANPPVKTWRIPPSPSGTAYTSLLWGRGICSISVPATSPAVSVSSCLDCSSAATARGASRRSNAGGGVPDGSVSPPHPATTAALSATARTRGRRRALRRVASSSPPFHRKLTKTAGPCTAETLRCISDHPLPPPRAAALLPDRRPQLTASGPCAPHHPHLAAA